MNELSFIYSGHSCIHMNSTGAYFLFEKIKSNGSGVKPWNNLFHKTEWIISIMSSIGQSCHKHWIVPFINYWRALCLPRTLINVLRIVVFVFFPPGTHCPSQGSVPPRHSHSTMVCISLEDKGLVKENFYQNVSPLSWGHSATWCQVLFLGLESRDRVCSVNLGSRSRSCPVSKPVC